MRVLVRNVPPFRAAAIRFVLAAAILGVASAALKLRFPHTPREWRNQVILGITMMSVPYGAVFWAEQHINASLATPRIAAASTKRNAAARNGGTSRTSTRTAIQVLPHNRHRAP